MPVIARINGITIKMYFRNKEHNPPHIHAIQGECVGVFLIENGEMLEGDLNNNDQRVIREFVVSNRNELLQMWNTQQFKVLRERKKDMINRIKNVVPQKNQYIQASFFNGVVKQYDMSQMFVSFPQFLVLKEDKELFESVKVDEGGCGIVWNDELDLDAETIWEDGILIEVEKESDFNHLLAYYISLTREKAQMTQKELAEKTGIYQADISKLERGLGNPSVSTLKRLAEGMGAELQIDFVLKNTKK